LQANKQSSPECPCCRKAIPKAKCTPLFPDTYENSILNDSQIGLGSSNDEEVIQLKNDIKKLNAELQEFKDLYRLQW